MLFIYYCNLVNMWKVGTSWFFTSASFKFWGIFFMKTEQNHHISIHQLLKAHLIANLELWSCTFFQHVTVLFHLYTFFKFLESFAYCVPLSASLKVTSATKLFFVIKQCLMQKKCFVLEISKFLCFCETHWFQHLWRHHKYCCIMQATLMLVSFES